MLIGVSYLVQSCLCLFLLSRVLLAQIFIWSDMIADFIQYHRGPRRRRAQWRRAHRLTETSWDVVRGDELPDSLIRDIFCPKEGPDLSFSCVGFAGSWWWEGVKCEDVRCLRVSCKVDGGAGGRGNEVRAMINAKSKEMIGAAG